MRTAVAPDPDGGAMLCRLRADGTPQGAPWHAADLPAEMAVLERSPAGPPRWVWAATSEIYPSLLRRGTPRLGRCHDVALVEALLLAHQGRSGEARSLGAAWARLHGRSVPDDPVSQVGSSPQEALFEPDRSALPAGTDHLAALVEVHADQQRRIAALARPDRFALLAAVESAGALAAAEMAFDGVPWRADVHDRLLTEQLGPRPHAGARPEVLADLAEQISAAFGRTVNPDSPAQLLRAFAAAGHSLPSTRSWVLKGVDHPAVPLLLRYKELSRLFSANGWTWLDTWVRDGRFRPDYVVGGVVSGRWATRGGGALQIPRAIRRAVTADPGWTLVAADAGQLEPRVLAALSGDHGLAAAAAGGDLYARLAGAFGGDRDRAKIAVLAAMYGQTGGDAAPLLRVMRRAFPQAMRHVDAAARAGEEGRLVRSLLGRTCPPPSAKWRRIVAEEPDSEAARRAARERGRFTRNFVIQATAAEWALVLMAAVRRRIGAEESTRDTVRLVFFQHDELVLHTPRPLAGKVVEMLGDAEAETRRTLFGETDVRFPLDVSVVECYADA
ncbi:bifunctional 3'-5' exonuclease/DNA polymerase [Marinactinospora thermotolerans]|uniref:DNA-directed DNA polymerase n=1 Tax=Marinactinospora thermotolerans DSM 45154 TaxID=1122192 RepID=A0A1T4RNW4_9ACTN|nr:bifunctional 3'-5' exonuclease/DNA polymerase [Marinactinospora thermotolerans]SKA17567.1 DNA polymerase-1 [Marinactinospora thermotolerans DSM 45154]